MPINLLDALLDGPFELTSRPEPVPGDLRLAWGMALVILILGRSRGKRASLQKLHFMAYSTRTRETRQETARVLEGHVATSTLVVRVEPWLNRALAFAHAAGLVALENGRHAKLTEKGYFRPGADIYGGVGAVGGEGISCCLWIPGNRGSHRKNYANGAAVVTLRFRHLRLRAETESGTFGADIPFKVGLNVLWADNTKGKSTCMQGLLYTLGLERMLSPRRGIPLTHVMTSHLERSPINLYHIRRP